jgi:hypothetical protein
MSEKLMRIHTSRGLVSLAAMILATLAMTSCGDVVRTGRAPVMLVMNSLTGGTPPESVVLSDVIVNVTTPDPCAPATPCPTAFNDPGTASVMVVMKDVTVTPTTNNSVTITRYHVSYSRADGRNTPGQDVPFPIDGASTTTIAAGETGSVAFELVRHTAKRESPLVELQANRNHISSTATVTFFGTDQVGNDISATGSIQIDFANFGDK